MTSFDRPSLLDNRYAAIAETSAYTYDDNDLVNYAEFLRKHSRYMSKKGYVDSSRRIRSLNRQQDHIELSTHRTTPSRGGGLLAAINTAPSSASSAPPITSKRTPRRLKPLHDDDDLATIKAKSENKKKEYEKQMRSIEEQMIRAKQSEREAKRIEGDIKKEQRIIRQSLRTLDVDTSRKRYYAEKNLSKNLKEKDHIERDFIKKKEKQTRQRTDHLVDSLQMNKDKDRRNLLLVNDLARQYRDKTNELDIKHHQLSRVHSDYEQKLQQKELEENRIKKELKDIALALSLEAQKAKNDMNDFLTLVNLDTDKDLKLRSITPVARSHDQERRRFSGDGTIHRSLLDLRQQDALRRIGETKSRLDQAYARQRALNTTSEQDRRATQLKSKMSDIDQRRSQLASQFLREKTIDQPSTERAPDKAQAVTQPHHQILLKRHEDRLKDIQTLLNKNEEIEHDLRQSVKEAEFQRRKKEQEVQRLKEDLIRKKREDAKKIHEAIARAEQEEKAIERHLMREKTKLDHLRTQRENSYTRLTQQRPFRQESKSLLHNHEREHERLLTIQSRSQSLQSLNTM